ncbi:ribonuclease Oy-like [Diachasmimorpha longicaudata]|uniref:ribonuclease Oy-like n=1 Tax=Diachasmimorpha longicaudata TaxID=58733 RepID=UPI0030B86B92
MSTIRNLQFLLWGVLMATNVISAPADNFDVLVYAQHWPKTSCYAFKQRNGNDCTFTKYNRWSIHGLWPSSIRGSYPEYCKNGPEFNMNSVRPLIHELRMKWKTINSKISPESFWDYQWKKHGVCATSATKLETPQKYFKKALELNSQYDIEIILKKAKIIPGKSYSYQDITNTLRRHLKYHSQIICYETPGASYLREIRICFNKFLKVVDCPPVKTCASPMNIIYPDTLPKY